MAIKLIEFEDLPQHVALMLSKDPYYLDRVTFHLQSLHKKQLTHETPVQEVEEIIWQIEYYSSVLAEIMKQRATVATRDEAFEQADINAQQAYDEQVKQT